MFKKILIVPADKNTEKHRKTIEKTQDLLIQQGMEFKMISSHSSKESDFKDIDLAITIGGNGTFIKAASFLDKIPILGINSEPECSEGALTCIKESETEELKKILDGEYKIIERQRAQVIKNNIPIKPLALNEVYIGSETHFHTSRYRIRFKEIEEEHRSSGVLISTGSGSYAWFKSAGGKPFHHSEKKLAFIVREPFHGNLFKPKILSGEIKDNEKIIFHSKKDKGGIIAIDSHLTHEFNIGDSVEIMLSDKPLRVVEKK